MTRGSTRQEPHAGMISGGMPLGRLDLQGLSDEGGHGTWSTTFHEQTEASMQHVCSLTVVTCGDALSSRAELNRARQRPWRIACTAGAVILIVITACVLASTDKHPRRRNGAKLATELEGPPFPSAEGTPPSSADARQRWLARALAESLANKIEKVEAESLAQHHAAAHSPSPIRPNRNPPAPDSGSKAAPASSLASSAPTDAEASSAEAGASPPAAQSDTAGETEVQTAGGGEGDDEDERGRASSGSQPEEAPDAQEQEEEEEAASDVAEPAGIEGEETPFVRAVEYAEGVWEGAWSDTE
eukprot:2038201-Rhodomonas_salina.1